MGKLAEKIPLVGRDRRWEDNIKIEIIEGGRGWTVFV